MVGLRWWRRTVDSRRPSLAVALALACAALVAGCGGGGAKQQAAPPPAKADRFDPANFLANPARGANRWDPMTPGRQSVREGRVTIGHRRLTHRRVYTVTDVTKRIDGVRAAVVIDQDFNGGQLAEQALDYLVEDKNGTVWYLGSYTETYEAGKFVNAADGWLAGNRGWAPGIMMKAHPVAGSSYYATRSPDRGTSTSQVVKAGVTKCVPLRCYRDTVVIQEGAPDETEYKYYAPGVGGILTEPHYKGKKQETELLVNATVLSPSVLAEIGREVLKVDRHARAVMPSVFGRSDPAKRGI
jgi:hypothetical protein